MKEKVRSLFVSTIHAFAKSRCPKLKPVIHFIEHSSHFFSTYSKRKQRKKKEKLAAFSFAEAVTVFIVYNEAAPWDLDEEQIDR